MTVVKEVYDAWKSALKKGDASKGTYSQIRAEFLKAGVALGGPLRELGDEDAITVLHRMAKQRKESVEEYRKGNRIDLVEAESAELAVIQRYLPTQLSPEELAKLIGDAVREVAPKTEGDAGKVMRILASQIKGKADGKQVMETVKFIIADRIRYAATNPTDA
jgi:uncharacterized protein